MGRTCVSGTRKLDTDKTDSCGPNDVFQRGYPLDWDGPVSLGSVNSGPVPTGRPTIHGLVLHEDKKLDTYGTDFACGTLFACGTEIADGMDSAYGTFFACGTDSACGRILKRNFIKNIFKKVVDNDGTKD